MAQVSFTREGFDRLREDEALLVSVVQRRFKLERSGGRWAVPRGEDGHSISIHKDRGGWRYYRFGQGDSGDVLDFLMRYEGAADALEAARMIGRLPDPPPLPPRRSERSVRHNVPWAGVDPARYLGRFDVPRKYRLWRAYKPLAVETIDRHRLGVGRLPGTRCHHERLVYPVFCGEQLVAIRGRAIDCLCPKWLSARGSRAALWGADGLRRPSGAVYVCENPVDAMFAMEIIPEVVAVASTAGAATWRPEWTEACRAGWVPRDGRPRVFYVFMDNDLAGCPNRRTLEAAIRLQAERYPGRPLPVPNGPRIARELALVGLDARFHHWPEDAPEHADLFDYVAQHARRAGRA